MKQTLVILMCVITSLGLADFGEVETVMEIPGMANGHTAFTVDESGNKLFVNMFENEVHLYITNTGQIFDIYAGSYSFITDNDYKPDIVIDENDRIHIVYPSGSRVMYCWSGDWGQSFTFSEIGFPCLHPRLVVNDEDVNVVCYENTTDQLTAYQYLRSYDEFETTQPSFFWGLHELDGPVHSNGDIWIYQGGGGNNNGYPTFHAMVTTSGEFISYPSGGSVPNMEDIFLGGWQENAPEVEMPNTDNIRANGIHPVTDPETDIFYVKICGSSWSSMIGKITETYQDIPVYSWFPQDAAQVQAVIDNGGNWYEDANAVHVNHVAVRDTIWTVGPGGAVNGGSVFIDYGKLWIEGCTQGMITFGCADSIIITGDLIYASTQVGQSPSGDNYNTSDLLGLISEESVIVGYKNYDPWMEVRNDANCNDVYLYGVFAAIGEGDPQIYGNMARHHDGMVTFEYQHPHGSTPSFVAPSPYTLQDTVYTLVDFQRNIFPLSPAVLPEIEGFKLHGGNPPAGYPCCGYPYSDPLYIQSYPNANSAAYVYPGGTDWPYYNPVWPESSDEIVFERGTLGLWGSVIQQRPGFLHRSGSDNYNHPPGNLGQWDIENQVFDGDHSATGYNVEYHYDSRLTEMTPPDLETIDNSVVQNTLHIFQKTMAGNQFTDAFQQEFSYDSSAKVLTANENEMLTVVVTHPTLDCLLVISHDGGYTFTSVPLVNPAFGDIDEVVIQDGVLYGFDLEEGSFYVIHEDGTSELLADQGISFINEMQIVELSGANPMILGSIFESPEGNHLAFNYFTPGLTYYDQIISLPLDAPCTDMMIDDVAGDDLTVYFSQCAYPLGANGFYSITGTLPDYTGVANTPKPNGLTLSNHPNPFNPSTEICFSLNSESTDGNEPVAIEIFNIRGQKVKTISIDINEMSSRPSGARGDISSSTTWDGTDSNNCHVASGVYFYQLKVGSKSVAQKKMMMIK